MGAILRPRQTTRRPQQKDALRDPQGKAKFVLSVSHRIAQVTIFLLWQLLRPLMVTRQFGGPSLRDRVGPVLPGPHYGIETIPSLLRP
jgi:hypothetical protein